MSRFDKFAILFCLGIFISSLYVSFKIYEGIPHIEDEIAFVWQARVIARGQIWVASPQPNPDSLKVPFVIDYEGKRFGKYPPGWPVVLAFGEIFKIRQWINPTLTSLGFWLLYRLLSKIINQPTAILAVGLGSVSPFVLMNSGSLLSHPWSLFLTLVFIIAWMDTFILPNPSLPVNLRHLFPTLTAAFSLALLALTRPWTAAAIAFPFMIHAMILFFQGDRAIRSRLVLFCLLTAGMVCLYPVWQYSVTNSPYINPYTLWWPYDRVGLGPDIGSHPEGYHLKDAQANVLFSLFVGNTDLFGWPAISWLFIPFGIFSLRRNPRAWLVAATFLSLAGAYALYWTPSWVTGPRYYYEALPAVLMLSAAGIYWLAGTIRENKPAALNVGFNRFRFGVTVLLTMLLITSNLFFYLPIRLASISGLYGISEKCTTPLKDFSDKQRNSLLIFVELKESFSEYSCTLELTNPFFDSKLISAISRGKAIDAQVANTYPDRTVYYYNPETRQFKPVLFNDQILIPK